ncbi:GyrI-like domain-containing protein [Sporosarcina sp. Marseille-Q4063]|uniref:GyrI-like domain-containing protein n=1 Tax=Sporosarcina sp. Marseille-Q4063 TaxID=2810514 RepID=UPI001BAF66EA|nr:GyrI-like domain-containing protein [Sporosarcina sp. Marseille-Q4063]QUW23563.1 GyrI-like domain-containing protein [Sporosarcina sp. Marseille-Q4063]
MKFEWRKKEKDLYIPKQKPELVTVPEQKFFMIKGKGNPNNEEFAERIGVLYSLAYAIRMMPKNGYTPEGYFEYTVYPLEGIWDLTEEGRQLDELNKDELLYTIMIRQPEFVTNEVVERAFERVRKKKPHPFLDDITFETMADGMSLQMLHVGPFEEEPQTFEKMAEYLESHQLERVSLTHREIYLSDMRRVDPAKLKTVLRYQVKPRA